MVRVHPRIDGVMHAAIAGFSPVTRSFDLRGCKEASWRVNLPAGERHPALCRGALVELMLGGSVVWSGVLGEPNWREGTMMATGLAYEASRYPTLDGTGAASANPRTVALANLARGWQITGVDSSVPNAAYTDAAEGSNEQTSLFDANADELGQRWYVGADRILRFGIDPTAPTWHIRPQLVDLGLADDEYASTVFVRYRSGTSTYATAIRTNAAAAARFGFRGYFKDVTSYGVITAARANAIGDGILAKGKASLGFTNSIEVSRYELWTSEGMPAELTMVEGGRQSVRVHGLFGDTQHLGGNTYLDVLIGESTLTDNAPRILLAPAGKVPETLDEISEAQTRLALGVA